MEIAVTDFKTFWKKILTRLASTISRRHFATWFSNTAIWAYDNGKLTIGVPSEIAKNWLLTKYHLKILQAAQEIDPSCTNIEYEVHTLLQDSPHADTIDPLSLLESEKVVRKTPNRNELIVNRTLRSYPLNPRYRLDNFVVGTDNRLPHAACLAVAGQPNIHYNPLFIYGGVGLGKTHLLQGTGNAFLSHFPDKVVLYITAEYFVSEVVEAIRTRRMQAVKDRYRNVDLLLVDDVQFFVKKESSQQEFFHTVDALFQANKQVVLTSDRPPRELSDIDKRLTSRFSMGMVVEVSAPDFETRLAILQNQCQEKGVLVDREVLEFLATHIHDNVRSLEGALTTLVMTSEQIQTVPTIAMVEKLLGRFIEDVPTVSTVPIAPLTTEGVILEVARHCRITPELLMADDRHKEVSAARQMAMYLIRNELHCSFEHIGRLFGDRNHTTVLHACEKIAELLRTDAQTVRALTAIKKQLGL